jgi:glutathione peroxidase
MNLRLTTMRHLILLLTMLTSAALADSPLYDIPLKTLDGKDTSLKAHSGKALLIVNVASQCGFTPQYAGLETLWKKYEAKGLMVLGFPCNDFGGQEPGTAEEIKSFCSSNYSVTFPLFAKVGITSDTHPLYVELTKTGKVGWNFTKFLIGKDGKVISKFDSDVEPESVELTGAIEKALK